MKCRSLTEENKKKEIKINQLEATLKVSDVKHARFGGIKK